MRPVRTAVALLGALTVACGPAPPAEEESPGAAPPPAERPAQSGAADAAEGADADGIDFRAVGQEPGWLLGIRDGETIRFSYAYGERELVAPWVAPEVDAAAGRTVYRAATAAHELTVTILDELCHDAMSGHRFPTTVTVELDGDPYHGCGRPLP